MATFNLTAAQWRYLRACVLAGGEASLDELREYTRPADVRVRLDRLVSYGLLEPAGPDRWRVTAAGEQAAGRGEYELTIDQVRAIRAAEGAAVAVG